jgi:hypothetical protein
LSVNFITIMNRFCFQSCHLLLGGVESTQMTMLFDSFCKLPVVFDWRSCRR